MKKNMDDFEKIEKDIENFATILMPLFIEHFDAPLKALIVTEEVLKFMLLSCCEKIEEKDISTIVSKIDDVLLATTDIILNKAKIINRTIGNKKIIVLK
jgi:hypothetical protein